MAKTAPIKPEDQFARNYVDRLILEKLSEMDSVVKLGELADKLSSHGIGLATVRSLLASNPARFAYHERRWVPAARVEAVGRPMNEGMTDLVHRFGGPMPISLFKAEICRIHGQDIEELEPVIDRILDKDKRFIVGADNQISLLEWSFVALDESFERALGLNQVLPSEVEEIGTKLAGLNVREPGFVAKAVPLVAPASLKALGAYYWETLEKLSETKAFLYDSTQFYLEATSVPGYLFAPDGKLYPEAETKKWVSTAIKLAERIAPTIDVEDAAPIEIKPEDVHKLLQKILAGSGSTTATKLLEENYEITPSNKTFPDDMTNIMTALKGQPSVEWVGGDRFAKAGSAPEYILSIPEPFYFVESGVLDEEGEPVDVELLDDGLSTTLRKLLAHPLATDVLDEDPQPAPKTMPETLRLVLKSIHRELGTFPMCQIPTSWLDADPEVQELIVIDPAGRELQIWVNQRDRLMYNWLEWWFEQPIESGSVFTLTKTPKPNVLEFTWLDQPDPVVYISSQRMEELRTIATSADGRSTLDLLCETMGHWPKGADYLTVLSEVNVIRRSSRRLIASLLSSYQCFYQRSGSPVWHFDAKKVEQGFDKAKKKFIKK